MSGSTLALGLSGIIVVTAELKREFAGSSSKIALQPQHFGQPQQAHALPEVGECEQQCVGNGWA